jgi:small subunit ribosomal protein S2
MSTVISMKALLESGVHFGHRTNKWDPHMRPYIFTERNGIHIIDLQQTVKALNSAYNLVRDTVANGGFILFIGTKRQAQETIKEEAERCGMPYVTERWLGGMLTNWSTMFARINELDNLEKLRDAGDTNRLTKKELLLISREVTRLLIRLSGVRQMKRVPDLVFVVDISREETAIHEANLTGTPVIAMVDTNCNPKGVDYVIPSNDDAIRAIKLMVAKIADAVIEGKASRKEDADMVEDASTREETAAAAVRHPVVDLTPELEDKDLFGDATLAKLVQPKPEEEIAVEEPVVVAEVPVVKKVRKSAKTVKAEETEEN